MTWWHVTATGPQSNRSSDAVPLLILDGRSRDGYSPKSTGLANWSGNFPYSRPRGPAAAFLASSGDMHMSLAAIANDGLVQGRAGRADRLLDIGPTRSVSYG